MFCTRESNVLQENNAENWKRKSRQNHADKEHKAHQDLAGFLFSPYICKKEKNILP